MGLTIALLFGFFQLLSENAHKKELALQGLQNPFCVSPIEHFIYRED